MSQTSRRYKLYSSYHCAIVFMLTVKKNSFDEKLPYVCGKSVFLRVEQSKRRIPKSRLQLVDDISSKITFDENLAICLSLRFRLSITIGLS